MPIHWSWSAPDDLVPTIKQLVASLDTDVEDTTVLKVFALRFADANETAAELSSLFPDDSKPDDNSNFSSRFRFGFFNPPQASPASNESDHVRRQNRVLAVPDPRTRSLIVSASKDMMPQIATMIEGLDSNPRNMQRVYVMNLTNAEVQDAAGHSGFVYFWAIRAAVQRLRSLLQRAHLAEHGLSIDGEFHHGTAIRLYRHQRQDQRPVIPLFRADNHSETQTPMTVRIPLFSRLALLLCFCLSIKRRGSRSNIRRQIHHGRRRRWRRRRRQRRAVSLEFLRRRRPWRQRFFQRLSDQHRIGDCDGERGSGNQACVFHYRLGHGGQRQQCHRQSGQAQAAGPHQGGVPGSAAR